MNSFLHRDGNILKRTSCIVWDNDDAISVTVKQVGSMTLGLVLVVVSVAIFVALDIVLEAFLRRRTH